MGKFKDSLFDKIKDRCVYEFSMEDKRMYLLNYSREPISAELYDARLAYSMHLAISEDGVNYQALNHNSGVLFVKATENEDGSLNPKSMKNPYKF